jgi:hypothetical protein
MPSCEKFSNSTANTNNANNGNNGRDANNGNNGRDAGNSGNAGNANNANNGRDAGNSGNAGNGNNARDVGNANNGNNGRDVGNVGNGNINGYESYANYDSYANYASINNKDCSPLQPPSYKLPIDSNSKNAFNKALETSLNTNANEYEPTKPNKFSIKPYDFDEYDAYLNISDIKTNNKDETAEYRTTPFLEDYLKNLRDNFKTPVKDQGLQIANVEQFTNFINNANNIKVDINLYNLFLFIFIGIIIILLCDQITKLAIIVANKNI